MNYKLFTNSEKTWKVMFEEIKYAKKSIYLEMYIFKNDIEKFKFFDLLKNKGRQGLQIKIILDSFGSIDLNKNEFLELKESGAEVIFMSDLFHRMHRKILIIDEYIAFVGGVNLEQKSRFWNDLTIRIKGNLVKKIVKSFIKSYTNAKGKDLKFINRNNKNNKKELNTWIIDHFPVRKKFVFKKIYQKHLKKAEKSIVLVTPYFIPKHWLSLDLHKAILRGVTVEILIPKNTDHGFVNDRVNYFYIYKLSKLGVRFYLEEKMNHAKAIIIDKKEALIGSQNLDFFSFDLNSEVGIFLKDPVIISKLLNIVNEWKKESILFDNKKYKPKWIDYIMSPLINIFHIFLSF